MRQPITTDGHFNYSSLLPFFQMSFHSSNGVLEKNEIYSLVLDYMVVIVSRNKILELLPCHSFFPLSLSFSLSPSLATLTIPADIHSLAVTHTHSFTHTCVSVSHTQYIRLLELLHSTLNDSLCQHQHHHAYHFKQ